MVEHSVLRWVSTSLAPRCLGLAVMILCGIPGAFAQNPEETPGLSLKLDWDLVPEAGMPGISRDRLLDAEAPELRERIRKVRDRVASMEQANAEKSAYLDEHEALIQRMRGAVAAQEEVIARLAEGAKRPESIVMAQEAATRPHLAPAPTPQVSTLAAPIQLGSIELPGTVRNHLMEGAFVGVLVILLGWTLYLRSVAKARAAELTILKGGRSARPVPVEPDEPGPSEEWPEPEPAPVTRGDTKPDASNRPHSETPAASPPPRRSGSDTEPAWSDTIVRQKASNPVALAEVDTLIAGGNLPEAKRLLDGLAKGDGDNPEYRLRLLHVDSALGDLARESEQEQILTKMSEGALSETRNRIKEIGRGLMPGHPLFDDDSKLAEAKRIISSHGSGGAEPAETGEPEAEQKASVTASAQQPDEPPLILDLEVENETIDFLAEINFDSEDEVGKKG
jgi:hypothetical protein